jgi:hypothetical protein
LQKTHAQNIYVKNIYNKYNCLLYLEKLKFIQKTFGLSKSKLQLLDWLNH